MLAVILREEAGHEAGAPPICLMKLAPEAKVVPHLYVDPRTAMVRATYPVVAKVSGADGSPFAQPSDVP